MSDFIIGIDEVGAGALAGPVYVCAFHAPKDWKMEGVRDSKKLTPKKRGSLFLELINLHFYGDARFIIASYDREYIDKVNIYNATHEAYYDAIKGLLNYSHISLDTSEIITDGLKFKETRYRFKSIVKGDDLVPHISAASIIAKVMRDDRMEVLHKEFPNYGWDKNRGYGTQEHLKALSEHGISPYHRRSFEPIKSMIHKAKIG